MTAPTTTDITPAVAAGQRFRALLAPLGMVSGDGRMIAVPDGEVRTRPLPMGLLYQEKLDWGHDGAVLIGGIDRAWVENSNLWIAGVFDTDDPVALTAIRRIAGGFLRGISADIDDATIALQCMRNGEPVDCDELDDMAEDEFVTFDPAEIAIVEVATDWRLMGATVCLQAAFPEAYIELDDTSTGAGGETVAAAVDAFAVIGDTDLPIADRDRSWDGAAAAQAQARRAGGVDNLDPARFAQGHFWRDDEADAATVGAYRLPFADVIDGTLTAVPAGIFAVAGVLQGARGGSNIPQADQDRIKGRVNTYYARMREQFDDPDIVAPWEASTQAAARAVVAAVAAPVNLFTPPATWFADPQLRAATPLRIDDDGHIYGHVAAWYDEDGQPTCHIGYPGTCRTVPHSASGYRYFHTGTVRTDAGDIAVGTLTLGCRHADDRASWAAAAQHYADSGQGVAVACAGEDEHGIWINGALCPTVTAEQRYTLGRVTLSGDWRDVAGRYELVGVLGVNVGGFPQTRATARGNRPYSLVGAGALRRRRGRLGASVDVAAIERELRERDARRNRAATMAVRAGSARELVEAGRRERAAALAARVGR